MKSSKKSKNEPAVSIYEADNIKDNSSLRSEIVEYAMQFIGNPYAYGGTSLTMGTDCSGLHNQYSKARVSLCPERQENRQKAAKNFL